MATKKKNTTTRTKKAKRIKKLPGIWESITQLSYYGTLWRVVVFMGVYLALISLYMVQRGPGPLGDTSFMRGIFEGLVMFVLAFGVYDGLLTTVIRRYPWHAHFDKVLLLGVEVAIAAWFLLDGAFAYATLEGGLEIALNGTLGYSLFWLLVLAAAWPPLRVFIGVSHQAMADNRKKR
jgi:hypothetical protein